MQTNLPDKTKLSGAIIHKTSYQNYLPRGGAMIDRLKYGINRASLYAKLMNPGYLHRLYLEKDRDYFRYLNDFKDKYSDREVERRKEVGSYKQLVGKEDYYSAKSQK